jgi:hypothetical protein
MLHLHTLPWWLWANCWASPPAQRVLEFFIYRFQIVIYSLFNCMNIPKCSYQCLRLWIVGEFRAHAIISSSRTKGSRLKTAILLSNTTMPIHRGDKSTSLPLLNTSGSIKKHSWFSWLVCNIESDWKHSGIRIWVLVKLKLRLGFKG